MVKSNPIHSWFIASLNNGWKSASFQRCSLISVTNCDPKIRFKNMIAKRYIPPLDRSVGKKLIPNLKTWAFRSAVQIELSVMMKLHMEYVHCSSLKPSQWNHIICISFIQWSRREQISIFLSSWHIRYEVNWIINQRCLLAVDKWIRLVTTLCDLEYIPFRFICGDPHILVNPQISLQTNSNTIEWASIVHGIHRYDK